MTQAKNSLSRVRGKSAAGDDAALRGATHVVEDANGSILLYLRPSMRMVDATGIQSEVHQYDAQLPGTSDKAFSIAYPAEGQASRTPGLYLSFVNALDPRSNQGQPLDKQQTELYHDHAGKPSEPEKTMARLTNGDKQEERWSMNILPSQRWIARCWPTPVGRFRNPVSSAEVLTLLIAPQVDLLLVAAVAFAKLNTELQIRRFYQSQILLGAPMGNLGAVGM